MSANLQVLVDSIDEGLLIVSAEGVVRLTNQAATKFFPIILGKKVPAEEVLVHISSAVRGYVRLPLEFELDSSSSLGSADRLRLKLLDSPVGGGYLLMIRNVSEAARYEAIISNFANLMSVELGEQMRGFSDNLNQLLIELVPDLERREELSGRMQTTLHQGREMIGSITQLATFAQAFSKSPILASNRIPIMEMVSALMARVRGLLDQRNIKLKVAGIPQDLPVVYGSRDWLVEALFGYIEHMVLNCRLNSDLELQVRPYGNFVSLQIRNHGRALPKRMVTQASPAIAPGKKRLEAGTPLGLHNLGLGMALCQHIVELHRGSMKLTDEDGDITAFVLELPAGAPPETINPSLGSEQARRYAEDLTRLMQRQRQAKPN